MLAAREENSPVSVEVATPPTVLGVVGAELALVFIAPIAIFFTGPISRLLHSLGYNMHRRPLIHFDPLSQAIDALGYNRAPVSNVWFLRDLYQFLNTRYPWENAVSTIQLFEFFTWVLLAVISLRIIVGLLTPRYFDARAWVRKKKISMAKAFAGLILLPPAFYFAFLNFVNQDNVALIHELLVHSRRAFVALQAFLIFNSAVLFVEGLFFSANWLSGSRRREEAVED